MSVVIRFGIVQSFNSVVHWRSAACVWRTHRGQYFSVEEFEDGVRAILGSRVQDVVRQTELTSIRRKIWALHIGRINHIVRLDHVWMHTTIAEFIGVKFLQWFTVAREHFCWAVRHSILT